MSMSMFTVHAHVVLLSDKSSDFEFRRLAVQARAVTCCDILSKGGPKTFSTLLQ